jgi:hypothetical protein
LEVQTVRNFFILFFKLWKYLLRAFYYLVRA